MEKVWLKRYPSYVPAEIDITQYSSVVDLFNQSAKQFKEKPAFVNLGKTLSYDDTDQLTAQFASYLTNDLGLKKGDRIAIMMPNLLQYPIALFGALRAGLIVVNTNPLYTPRELKHQLNDSGATTIVILENFANTLQKVLNETPIKNVILTAIGDLAGFPKSLIVNFVVRKIKKMVPAYNIPNAVWFNSALKLGSKTQHTDAEITRDDIAFLQYTGGTTGVAKGAMLSHGNMIANMLQAIAWTSKDLKKGEEIFITALPMYHIFALTANALFAMELGAKNVLITNPRDMPGFVKELAKEEPFSVITGVNTLFNALLHAPGFDKLDFSNVKLALGGGMTVQKAVADPWQEITGSTLLEAYGLTEASPALIVNPLDIDGYNGYIGIPIPSTEISLRDENNKEVAVGERGEICARGPQVMKGYWQRPDETAKAIDEDGWLHTGDIATMNEEGFIAIVDRLKDMILVSGFNVYPNEIEEVISEHNKVMEVGVIGIPHEKTNETICAVIVKKDDSLTEDELKEHIQDKLTAYKRPKKYVFVDELPKTNVGKILRRELRVEYGQVCDQ